MHIVFLPLFGYWWACWWLIFPAMGIVSGIVRMILHNNYRRRRLEIIKAYADQGKDVPEALRREFF